ncbi:MAG: PQQ-binding-like beta-propeller repeat protein [Bacteroidota bacterium]
MIRIDALFLFIFLCINSNLSAQHLIKSEDVTRWKYQTKGPVYATPLVHEEVIYIGSLDSIFYALDADRGFVLWSIHLPGPVFSNATVHNNLVYVESNNVLFALNLNGELQWKARLAEPDNPSQLDPWDFHHPSPVVYNATIYVAGKEGLITGFDVSSGEIVFRVQTPEKIRFSTTPVIHEGIIYAGDWEGEMHAFDLENKKNSWTYDTKADGIFPWKNTIHGIPVIHRESIIFSGRNSRLYAVDKNTGKKIWMAASPTNQWMLGGPVIDGEKVFTGSSDQHLYQAFDCNTGTLLWKTSLDCRIWTSPVFTGDNLIVASRSIYVLNKHSGEILKQITFPQFNKDRKFGEYNDRIANFHSSPVHHGNSIIIGGDDGVVYCLDGAKLLNL